jgi:uncharacterized protein (TIGR02147 family)
MSGINIWKHTDYKKFLRAYIDAQENNRGISAKLAKACGCHSSYFSHVLTREVHLTPEHALALAESIHLAKDEITYFCLMVDIARAGTPSLRNRIKQKMTELREENSEIGKRLARPILSVEEHQAIYYSTWLMAALHILSSIPAFQTIRAAAQRLGVPEENVRDALYKLESLNLVRRSGESWVYAGGESHLPDSSPLISLHHQNWRSRAVLDAQSKSGQGLHFSGVYAVGREDLVRIKEVFLEALRNANAIAAPAPCEELVCITCDVFRP